uniref:Uncharacterized protein n=1 Tax=Arundo donax TaxID=35708 RepID=A0A0A9A9H2_ARUDO
MVSEFWHPPLSQEPQYVTRQLLVMVPTQNKRGTCSLSNYIYDLVKCCLHLCHL